jgi:V8-like Glu-specific endopeptidase
MKIAKPMEKLLAKKPAVLKKARLPAAGVKMTAPTVVVGNQGPADDVADEEEASLQAGGKASPRNYGSGNQNTVYHYSDSLVDTKIKKTFPHRATGFFLFRQGGNWFYCSAALISKSILLTAGHCVHSGNNSASGWNTEGYFYPAGSGLNGGTPNTPYDFASAYTYWTWTAWYQTGALDQGYDVALVVLNKRSNPKPAKAGEIGNYTGWLGFCTSNCLQTYWSFTQLGYPGNYYGGNHMTEGHHLYVSDSRDYVWGSGMRGGSSGGPHIANLGALSDSATDQGQWTFRNIVFAPTSWGYISEAPKVQGGSALTGPNNTFDFNHGLFNPACPTARGLHGTGSCTLFP